ncbi:MAG: maleylacetoacetate isomerase [Clostridia bacterium]|nr:maleylacetoacetate isomerase [Deltaproteobacteria bacterium]
MKLHNYWRSTSSWRVRIALALKNVQYDYVAVHLVRDGGQQHSGEHRAKNAMEQVPVLELDDGTLVTQSLAIIHYLDEEHPAPSFLPVDTLLRARARSAAEIMNSGMQPLHNLAVLERLRAASMDEKAWIRHFMGLGFAALEAIARAHGGTYLIGDAVSLADICLVPQIYAARRFDVDLQGCKTLVSIADRVAAEDAFVKTHPDRQPDASA